MAQIDNTPVSFSAWNTVLAGDQTLDNVAREVSAGDCGVLALLENTP